jgi:hypothetical protein
MNPATILERLDSIERDLADRQPKFEQAANAAHRTTRDMELRMAQTKLATTAKTETEKKDKALTSIAAADDDLYERWVAAEADDAGLKAVVKVLEARASIGQSLLRTQRETGG